MGFGVRELIVAVWIVLTYLRCFDGVLPFPTPFPIQPLA